MSISLTGFMSPAPTTASRSLPRETAFGLLAGFMIFAAILWLPVVLRDPDTLWHITTGNWIIQNHGVPRVDTYSFTRVGQPWAAHEWLSEVVLALAYDSAGWNGVMVLTAAAAGSVIGLVAFSLRRHVRIEIAVMLVLLAVASGGPSLLSRPHVIALPVVTLWTIGLVASRARGMAPPLLMLPLMTIWANLHGGFLVGLVLTGALALEALFDPACDKTATIRGWGIFLIGTVVAAAVTPMGVDTLLFPFRLMSMKNLYAIQEWKPSDFSHLTGVTVAILVGLYTGLTGIIRLPKFRVLLLVGLVFATMQHVRNAQLFGILAPLLIANSLASKRTTALPPTSTMPERLQVWTCGAVAVLSLAFRLGMPLERVDEGGYAADALASVPAELRTRPVLNEYGFGGLLIFDGIRPFIDGRADLYGDDFMDMYLAIVHAKGDMLDEVLCRYGIEWTMFGPETVVPALMDRTAGWHRLYSDKVAVIHVRDHADSRPTCSPRPAG